MDTGSADQHTVTDTAGEQLAGDGDIVVVGRRVPGSAIGDVEPIAVLDQDAIRSIGATSLKALIERLKPLTTSTDGSEPVYLLNGRRVSGLSELDNLPPEAIERTEVLPESEASRFGFPPTVRVSNFITKKHFRAVTVQQVAGTTTEGGGGTDYVEVNSTRINGPRRLSVSLSHLRLSPILQSQRSIAPDPDALYAVGGTVTGINGGSIDPGLDALAGHPVTVSLLPDSAAARRSLASYLTSPNTAAVSDIGAYRSLQQRSDTVDVSATLASPIGKSLDGSLNVSMEAQGSSGVNGLAPAVLQVPGGSGNLPFADDVLVYRYLPNAVLRQRSASLNLHVGGTLQGGIRRWAWNVTGSYDRLRSNSRSDQGVTLDGLQAAVDAGADPLTPLGAIGAGNRLVDRSSTVTGTFVTKAVATGPLLRLPAGDAQMTVSADYARSSSTGEQSFVPAEPFDFVRTTKTASVSASLPVASSDQDVLPFLGHLALNGMVGVADVSGYGRLTSSSYGATWTPGRLIQFSATISDALTPPDITLLTSPVVTTPNTPFFDFTTGSSVLVTTLMGGRAALLPERRRRSQFGVALTPIKGKELRLSADYIDTRLANQTATLGSATTAFQTAFPGAFVRDASNQLVSVDLRPVNIDSEHERRIRLAFNLSTPIGRAPPPAPVPGAAPATTPPPKPPKPRPTVSATVTSTVRLDDRLTLQPGSVPLDLLGGATLTGVGGKPRWETEIDFRGTAGPLSLGLYGRLQGPTRIRSDLAQSDLFFSGRIWLIPYSSLDAGKLVDRPWARNMTLFFTIENLLNDRVDVRDRTGATPNRFQSAYQDPLGRSVRLGVRKQF
ncbi:MULTISPECIES: TonB-dependent receptor [unclassified Sphingomonas]|uniref:TonB-dependent receptor n=1 Tax=unclassified Sphingomonas TaxID=196159 RepID=UPI00226ADB23|nr:MULTISPECIES: TonB-dependent receptor [unclassified Sphingomonas]